MSLLVSGTIGLDTVETPQRRVDGVLGGSAAYFSIAASILTPVRLVAAVGEDFPPAFRRVFEGRNIDTAGLEVRAGSKTFAWHGRYLENMNERETLRTDLNVISEASPRIPPAFRDSEYVFLANTHPVIQREFIEQLARPRLIVLDTMNLWIESFRDDLLRTLKLVHGVVVNDGEARQLTGADHLVTAGQAILTLGPRFVVIKKGEHGAMLVTADDLFVLPAIPSAKVVDPTGAGDSFAGGMMGHLASVRRDDPAALRAAIARGTCVASITIEGFSLDALAAADRRSVEERLTRLRSMTAFD